MILLMSMDSISRQAAEQLSHATREEVSYFYDTNLSDIRSSSITLVDLRADSKFQDCHNAESFADFFYENKLSPTVKEIYLMVSDVNPDNFLLSFTDKFIEKMRTHGIELPMYACGSVNASATFIVPPEQTRNWKIYSVALLRHANLSEPYSYEQFKKATSKMVCMWEGEKIHEWLKEPSLTRTQSFYKKFTESSLASKSKMRLEDIGASADEAKLKVNQLSVRGDPSDDSDRLKSDIFDSARKIKKEERVEDTGDEISSSTSSVSAYNHYGKHPRDASTDLENSPSPAKKKTPPMSTTSPPMRLSSSSSSSLFYGSHVDPLPSENLSVSSDFLTPRAIELCHALSEELGVDQEKLHIAIKELKKQIIGQRPAVIRAGGE